jgi:DNA-binding FadR family transcriptional regulator
MTSLDPQALVEPINLVLKVDDGAVFHLLEVCRLLEAGAEYLAAERISDDEFVELDRCLVTPRAHKDD